MASGHHDLYRQLEDLEGLYERSPEQFEECSRRLIREFIDTAPENYRARMWGVQLRIDAELSHYHDPVARMNRMVELLWDQVRKFRQTLENPEQALMQRGKPRKAGKVLPFRGRDKLH